MKRHEIQINLPGLLRMLGENIYAEPDVAVREMIQNAHDTCVIRSTKDKGFKNPKIQIAFSRSERTLTITDNGAGMTEKELHKNLATIGESFTRIQRDELRDKDAQEAALLIGQFGIGLLSAFSVSRRVEVFTRSFAPASSGLKWICDGDIHYTVEPEDKAEPGTRVVLHLSDTKLELLKEQRLRQAIKKYADFLSIPILLNDQQVNACEPPWEVEEETLDLSDYIQQRWDLFPLGVIPFDTAGAEDEDKKKLPRISGLLFIPMIPSELTRDFGEVDVYISRMFIKASDKDLLPRWARFVKGVVNTPELTPTLSRGEIIADEKFHAIRELLGNIVLAYLDMLQKDNRDTLAVIVGAYNNTIKARALEDDVFFDRICDLVRVNTDLGHLTMKEYLEKSSNAIYFFAERGTGTQHKLLFSHKDLPVIDASWGTEEEFLEKYAERKNIPIERLSAASDQIFKVLETADEKWRELEIQFHRRVGKEAKTVEFEPETVPAVLVARPLGKEDKTLAELDAFGAQMGISSESIKSIFRQMAKTKAGRTVGEDTILHLNVKNPLMRQLREMKRNETFYLALTCIYNNAIMFAHHYVSPQNAEVIFEANNTAFSAMIANAKALEQEESDRAKMGIELDELKRRYGSIELNPYRSCFFAYPFKDDFHKLRDEIAQILKQRKYGVRLTATSLEMGSPTVVEDIKHQISKAHFGIADITGNNPNVMWELGYMYAAGKQVILLKDQEDGEKTPFDVYGQHRVNYHRVKDNATGRLEFALLEKGLERNMELILKQNTSLEKATESDD